MNRRQFLGSALAALFSPPLPAIETQQGWREHGTVTGRMSSSAPPIRNMRSDYTRKIADYAAADARMTRMIEAMFAK